MITIKQPKIISFKTKARLQAEFNIDGKSSLIWFKVDKQYKNYLCYEHSDAFIIGVLNYAMKNNHDIVSKAPISEELYYQITTYLIDALYKGSNRLHKTEIIADIDNSKLKSANAVGTGMSCGVDSFHAILNHTNSKFKNHNITHLAFNNVGSHGRGTKAIQLYIARKNLAKKFAKNYNYEFIESNSNIHEKIIQSHILSHTYSSCFAIYALKKLYSIYYYSSGRSFFEFDLKNNENKDCAYYELLSLNMFSTSTLKIFSEGATSSRLEKIKKISTYPPSYKYLNVCTESFKNCNKCVKCTKTLLALDLVGKLDCYKTVFDIDYYKNNKPYYNSELVCYALMKDIFFLELFPYFKKRILIFL